MPRYNNHEEKGFRFLYPRKRIRVEKTTYLSFHRAYDVHEARESPRSWDRGCSGRQFSSTSRYSSAARGRDLLLTKARRNYSLIARRPRNPVRRDNMYTAKLIKDRVSLWQRANFLSRRNDRDGVTMFRDGAFTEAWNTRRCVSPRFWLVQLRIMTLSHANEKAVYALMNQFSIWNTKRRNTLDS